MRPGEPLFASSETSSDVRVPVPFRAGHARGFPAPRQRDGARASAARHVQSHRSRWQCPRVLHPEDPAPNAWGDSGLPDRRGSVVGVPSLVAHRCSHFMDGAVNFLDGAVPRAGKSRPAVRLQQFARLPQVGKGMEIVGTLGLSRCSQSKEQESRQPENCCGKCLEHTHFSSTFHG